MTNEQDHTEKHSDLCQSVHAEIVGNTVDGQSIINQVQIEIDIIKRIWGWLATP